MTMTAHAIRSIHLVHPRIAIPRNFLVRRIPTGDDSDSDYTDPLAPARGAMVALAASGLMWVGAGIGLYYLLKQ